jgi:hypothetical protein
MLYLALRMSCVAESPPPLVRGSLGDETNTWTRCQVKTKTRTVPIITPAAMTANSRFVKSSVIGGGRSCTSAAECFEYSRRTRTCYHLR